MVTPLLKMHENRVRRNYIGGKILETIRGTVDAQDSDRPEEWICSMVEAVNPGLDPTAGEGLSKLEDTTDFKRLITQNSKYYLGKENADSLGFLVKWIDSKIRLHVQAHPTKAFSQKHLGVNHGKFECYYILAARDTVKDPYIRLGFQNPPKDKETWKEIVLTQDMEAMDNCFIPIPVKPGDVIYIPGGVPHAIGEGLLLLEVMEPSDLVVRCEFNREGIIVPPEARFMNKGIDFCMDIFDYSKLSPDEVINKYFIEPELLFQSKTLTHHKLLDPSISECFELQRIIVQGESQFELDGRYAVAVCSSGEATISCEGQSISISILDSFFIAHGQKTLTIQPLQGKPVEICLILPIR